MLSCICACPCPSIHAQPCWSNTPQHGGHLSVAAGEDSPLPCAFIVCSVTGWFYRSGLGRVEMARWVQVDDCAPIRPHAQSLCVGAVSSSFATRPSFGDLPPQVIEQIVDGLDLDLDLELAGNVSVHRPWCAAARRWRQRRLGASRRPFARALPLSLATVVSPPRQYPRWCRRRATGGVARAGAGGTATCVRARLCAGVWGDDTRARPNALTPTPTTPANTPSGGGARRLVEAALL